MSSFKYSIIIPVYNGMPYLKACVESIACQNYNDYELIISDDKSTDGSCEYLAGLNIPNLKLISPDERLSMTEHWDWALSHAKGDWQIFVGQDDGLQPYFFELADRLTAIAEKKRIRSIMSSRAYYFWPGCEPVYGDIAMQYSAEARIKILKSFNESFKALFGIQDYFELPQMYTTSLFHKSLLDDARNLQAGKLLLCHPQDANLGVISASLESEYIKSFVPLGWVGSSTKSAGLAITSAGQEFASCEREKLLLVKEHYSKSIQKSPIAYCKFAGDFSFGNTSIYFWQCFLQTPNLRSLKINCLLESSLFKYMFFAAVDYKILTAMASKRDMFNAILNINKLNSIVVRLICVTYFFFKPVYFVAHIAYRVLQRVLQKLYKKRSMSFIRRSDCPDLTLNDASKISRILFDKLNKAKLM